MERRCSFGPLMRIACSTCLPMRLSIGVGLRLAQLNRVTSLLHQPESDTSSDVPEPVKAQLQATHFNNTLHSLRLKAELIRVLKAFENAISVMPLKASAG